VVERCGGIVAERKAPTQIPSYPDAMVTRHAAKLPDFCRISGPPQFPGNREFNRELLKIAVHRYAAFLPT
jgi:hypothetical protein